MTVGCHQRPTSIPIFNTRNVYHDSQLWAITCDVQALRVRVDSVWSPLTCKIGASVTEAIDTFVGCNRDEGSDNFREQTKAFPVSIRLAWTPNRFAVADNAIVTRGQDKWARPAVDVASDPGVLAGDRIGLTEGLSVPENRNA